MKAIIFDFDGTMIDTENLWHEETMRYVKENYDITIPAHIYQAIIGTSEEPLHEYLLEKTAGRFNVEKFTAHIAERLHGGVDELELREGFLHIFNYAVQNNFKIGLATSSGRDWVIPVLEKFELLKHFSSIQTADDVTNIKPHPELYIKAIEELGAGIERTFAVEDSLNGTLAAKEAGIQVIVVPNEATSGIKFPADVKIYPNFEAIPLTEVFK
ncbi:MULTISPECIES: HAD family phosphatase [Listeria]|uniref:HAD family hydrolase n=1 Tax=Listeria TaxID=1637 RepID=UPI000B58F86D|nr:MULTISPECIES: HAD-IA family hydrolase [Listeria]